MPVARRSVGGGDIEIGDGKMAVLAQHGYGKSRKINKGLRRDIVEGVVLSPQYEKPENLRKYVLVIAKSFERKMIVVDPQFYVTALEGPKKEGRLPEYPYYRSGLTRRQLRSPRNISRIVHKTLDYEMKLPVTQLITPTVLIQRTDESFFEFALQLAEGSMEYHSNMKGAPPLLVSLVISEDILKSRTSTDELLDGITLYDVSGFYVIVDHRFSSYDPQFKIEVLSNLLYLTYSLSELNDFKVVFGYSSFVGLLLHAVGASFTACGWFGTSKRFSVARFRPSTGGRPARPRYSSIPLLNSILVSPELSTSRDVGKLDEVLTGTSFDGGFRTNFSEAEAAWSMETSVLHHWEALTSQTNEIVSQGGIRARVDYLLGMIDEAETLYEELFGKGVQFEVGSGRGHLDKWRDAILDFREAVSL